MGHDSVKLRVVARFVILYICIGFLLVTAQQMTSNGNIRTNPRTLVTVQNEQVLRGADLYFDNCSVCHGDTGLGLNEAKTTFPEEHRKCTRCHRPGNSKFVNWNNIQDNNMFDLGQPAALRGEKALATFSNAEVLYTYIKSTMPRYQPGYLKDTEYMDITAFLIQINNALPESLILTEQSALDITLD